MKGLQLSDEEKQLIIESLLFTSNVDVCSEHTEKQRAEMLNLVEKLNSPEIKLHNIYFHKSAVYEEKSAETLLQRFPNVPAYDIFTD